jgi:succinyl-CoA synthetase beta subunit
MKALREKGKKTVTTLLDKGKKQATELVKTGVQMVLQNKSSEPLENDGGGVRSTDERGQGVLQITGQYEACTVDLALMP